VDSYTGIRYVRYPQWYDVLVDGSLRGTVRVVPGGWVFYRPGNSGVPDGVGSSRDAATHAGLTQ